MAHDGQDIAMADSVILEDLLTLTGAAVAPAEAVLTAARNKLTEITVIDGRVSGAAIEENQCAAHGLAWLATYVESLRQMQNWANRLNEQGKFGEVEQLIHQIAFGEYLWQIYGGIQMNQGEIIRLQDIGLDQEDMRALTEPAVMSLTQNGNTQAARMRLVELMQEQSANITVGTSGLDEELEMIREQFRRFAVEKVEPHAHDWHLRDELIPMEVIEELAELGVFGLTIPGGARRFRPVQGVDGRGLRGTQPWVYRCGFSRDTVSEIAAELILCGGTDEQKGATGCLSLSSAEILPTAVFTEPNTGSDLGSLRTRAPSRTENDYRITGNKTWITHAARTHVMTLLGTHRPRTRTDHRGLSMFLAEKTPGTDEAPFPDRRA